MTGIIQSAIEVVAQALRLANSKEASKWRDRATNIRLALAAETAKGYDADDAKIERLYAELRIVLDAAYQELLAAVEKK